MHHLILNGHQLMYASVPDQVSYAIHIGVFLLRPCPEAIPMMIFDIHVRFVFHPRSRSSGER